METLETVPNATKRHKKIRRHSTSLDIHAQSMRRPPEGDSIIEKEPMKLGPPPAPTGTKKKVNENKSAAMKRRKRKNNMSSDSGLETAEDDVNVKRSRNETRSDFLTSLGPLNDISSIHPVLDCTMESTFSKKSKSKLDVTWEKAVCNARGQPDGAERSMRITKTTSKNPDCSIIEENDENVIPPECGDEAEEMAEDDDDEVEIKKMEKMEKKKKSLKVSFIYLQ